MFLRRYIVPFLIVVFYKVWSWTWRCRIHEPDELKSRLKTRDPFVLAHWHGDELVLLQVIGPYRIATMTSNSKDGAIMTGVVQLLGGKSSRGSSSRGGANALRGLLRLVKNEKMSSSVAVDGPRGPLHKVKPGVFEIARLLKAPIFVSGVACNKAIHFPKAWNKTFLPKLFAKVEVVWEGPYWVDKSEDPRDPELAKRLEESFRAANASALKLIAGHDAQC